MNRLEEYGSRGGDFDGHTDHEALPIEARPEAALPGADGTVQPVPSGMQLVEPLSVYSVADSDCR